MNDQLISQLAIMSALGLRCSRFFVVALITISTFVVAEPQPAIAQTSAIQSPETSVDQSAQVSSVETPAGDVVVVTLQDAVRRALAFSPDIQAAQYGVEAMEHKRQQATFAGILPDVTLRLFGGPVPNIPDGSGPESGFPPVDVALSDLGLFFRTRIEGLQPIYGFGRLSRLRRASESGVLAEKAHRRSRQLEIVYQIKRVYWGLSYLKSLQSFMNDIQTRSTQAKRKVEEKLAAGDPEVTDIDLMRMSVFTSEIDRRMIELNTGLSMTHQSLRALIGLPPPTHVDIADNSLAMEITELKDVDHYLQRAWVARPDLAQLRAGVEALEHVTFAKRAEFFPFLFLGGFWNYAVAPGRQDVQNPFLLDEFNMHVGGGALGLQQNLSFHMTQTRYKEQVAALNRLRAQHSLALLGVELEIRRTYAEAQSRLLGQKNAEQAFRSGRSWVLASTLNFSAGLVPIKDLLEAFLTYSKVRVSYLDLVREFNEYTAKLSQAVGEDVGGTLY